MNPLQPTDVHFLVSRLPKDVCALLKEHPGKLFVAGGFIRATIARERVNDIDLFGASADELKPIAMALALSRRGKLHETKNAFTVLAPPRHPVQFIQRWTFTNPTDLVASFDFTVAQAAIWFENDQWQSLAADGFYPDLAARRLVYCAPVRDEEAGGSFLRMRKFIAAGYTIQPWSMAQVTARLVSKIDFYTTVAREEHGLAKVICGLLREVDPLTVVDGIEVVDEHEIEAPVPPAPTTRATGNGPSEDDIPF